MEVFEGFNLTWGDGRYLYVQIERDEERSLVTYVDIVRDLYGPSLCCWNEFSNHDTLILLFRSLPWFLNGSVGTLGLSDWTMGEYRVKSMVRLALTRSLRARPRQHCFGETETAMLTLLKAG